MFLFFLMLWCCHIDCCPNNNGKDDGYHFENAVYQEAWRVSAASWAFLLMRASHHVHTSQVAWSPIYRIYEYIHYLNSSISGPNSHFEHRSMTIKTLEDFVEYMRTYMVSKMKTMVTWSHLVHSQWKILHWDIWLFKILQLLEEIPGEGNVQWNNYVFWFLWAYLER